MKKKPVEAPKTAVHLADIRGPEDLKALSDEELSALAGEIRTCLCERVEENGGHLASNLGVVELTLAIHRVFDSPKDHVIFDVGHQSYVHKLLTGRYEQFDTLRRPGGLGGFPKRSESEHDAFGTGHASTSISAALGFAEADKLSGSDAYTVCLFGDGAYTGGMIHEALNNNHRKLRLILILNENEMSISKNTGRFAKNISKIRARRGYYKAKKATVSFLWHIPLIGKPIYRLIHKIKRALKSALYGSNYFENLGFTYYGPVDGNDEAAVENLLREAKRTGRACVLHVKTKKGKGYAPAEENPDRYHGLSPKNCKTDEVGSFSKTFGEELCALAKEDPRLIAITAAMVDGTGLCEFAKTYPQKFFDVGIAEEHAVTFAAGLAAAGMRPVVAIYSTFLQRAYDNILHDVALQNLPVVFCIDRAGLNSSDGPTHHGIFDVAFLSQVPGLTLYTPATHASLKKALKQALSDNCPAAVRYPKGGENSRIVQAFYPNGEDNEIRVRSDFDPAKKEALDSLIITHGRIAAEALAAKELAQKEGKSVGILLLEQLKPYEKVADEILPYLPQKACKVLFLEEEIYAGGMGMMMRDSLDRIGALANKKVSILALRDSFGIQECDEPLLRSVGLDKESILKNL
ncbi:MAG: 1-deoxy-D-xylulose-5-phosphate synthase [Clostridia bacterium]|nr:1-deoxy-D-xylulose-5-phosphate synthase [Clostridia bacterium]